MGEKARQSIVLWAALVVGVVLCLGFLASLLGARAGEVAGALGSVVGGAIGALGAAAAVYIMLWRQRVEEAEKVSMAVLREVLETCRFVIGQLGMCEKIRTGEVAIPKSELPRVMQMPVPIIYPAVADRISLLPSPTLVVSFYSRLSEAQAIMQVVAYSPSPDARLPPTHVDGLADVFINVCQLGDSILNRWLPDPGHEKALYVGNRTAILKRIGEQLESAKKVFPDAVSFGPPDE